MRETNVDQKGWLMAMRALATLVAPPDGDVGFCEMLEGAAKEITGLRDRLDEYGDQAICRCGKTWPECFMTSDAGGEHWLCVHCLIEDLERVEAAAVGEWPHPFKAIAMADGSVDIVWTANCGSQDRDGCVVATVADMKTAEEVLSRIVAEFATAGRTKDLPLLPPAAREAFKRCLQRLVGETATRLGQFVKYEEKSDAEEETERQRGGQG